jgi:predicted RND superfamily exporter protein
MESKTVKRLIRAVAAALALGFAAWSYTQAGVNTETSVLVVIGVLFGLQAATGVG